MSLNNEEKAIIEQALSYYVQIIAQQAPKSQVQKLVQIAQGIINKLDSVGTNNGTQGAKPQGISDEWFTNVCESCDKLSPGGCTDKVTEKFPGKCDPILHYERNKLLNNK
ncbi:MAG: hypothetical protein GX640_07450 [Fibrobacter sp.]|nr:hypothetical protein [Fibrobacter sp.]